MFVRTQFPEALSKLLMEFGAALLIFIYSAGHIMLTMKTVLLERSFTASSDSPLTSRTAHTKQTTHFGKPKSGPGICAMV